MKKLLLLVTLTYLVCNISCKKNPASSQNTAPIASFTVNPTSGTVETVFNFNASGCTDNEDEISILEVRWDWNNDGSWDTNFSTTKTATHQYSSDGTYTIKLEVKDSEGLSNSTTKTVSLTNTAPTAFFTVDPTSGTTATTFTFDASGCTDNEDDTSILEVRWDFEDDGTWDTNYSTSKIVSHQYSVIKCGGYTVKLEVKDSEGKTKSITMRVDVDVEYDGTVTDIDGNVYNIIEIGAQIWMAENLKVTHYRNGDAIPNVTGDSEWSNLSTDAYCNYDNIESNTVIYGRLYNWYTVDDNRGLAPDGWHVPNDEEWKELEMYLGMSQTTADILGTFNRGRDEGAKIKSCGGWAIYNNGTNESGFTALPGGTRNSAWGNFVGKTVQALFWSSTKFDNTTSLARELDAEFLQIFRLKNSYGRGISVRCIKD